MSQYKSISLLLLVLFLTGCSSVSVMPSEVDVNILHPVDSSTNALLTIDYAHHEIPSGSHFNYRDFYMLAKNSNKDFLITTPTSGKEAHFIMGIEGTSSSISVFLYENATAIMTGTPEPIINRNRNSNNTNELLLYEDPVMSSVGTELAFRNIWSW